MIVFVVVDDVEGGGEGGMAEMDFGGEGKVGIHFDWKYSIRAEVYTLFS